MTRPTEKVVRELSLEEIKTAYQELYDWKYKTAFLVDGVVRRTHKKFEELTNTKQDLSVIESAILFEIGRRFIEGGDGNEYIRN